MLNKGIKLKTVLISLFIFSNILLNQESLAIVTKSNGSVSYKNYLKKDFIDKLNAGTELFNNDLACSIFDK